MTMQSRFLLIAALGLAAVSWLAAGCGGDPSTPAVANIGTTSTTTSSSSDGSSNGGSGGKTGDKDPTKFAECMRSNGVPNFPDPDTEGGIDIGPNSGINPDSEKFKAAERKCQDQLGIQPPTAAEQAQQQEQALRFSACMRANGVPNFPDPQFSEGKGELRLPRGLNPKSPQFRAAQEKCQKLMPRPKGAQTQRRGAPGS
ncbi:MAG TPA: hypothetical protein VGQ15_01605 [Gaiellaceae bacterium]|jgi:hypothetical protein|nr:hypothetical protein [Gaiellaceae bacterium]